MRATTMRSSTPAIVTPATANTARSWTRNRYWFDGWISREKIPSIDFKCPFVQPSERLVVSVCRSRARLLAESLRRQSKKVIAKPVTERMHCTSCNWIIRVVFICRTALSELPTERSIWFSDVQWWQLVVDCRQSFSLRALTHKESTANENKAEPIRAHGVCCTRVLLT